MIVMFISLDLLRLKIEKLMSQVGVTEMQQVKDSMVSLTSKNFLYPHAKLIVIDVTSAGFDATEVIKNLKANPKSKQLPILAIGNQAESEAAQKYIKMGCTDYIKKPFEDLAFANKALAIMRAKVSQPDSNRVESPQPQPITQLQPEAVPMENIKLTWNASFEIGIAAIDEEHRTIVENFEKLYLLMMSGQGHGFYTELLTFLNQYIETHFANEEAFQKSIGYDRIDEHVKRHQFFKEKILSMIEAQTSPISNADLIKLNLFIKDWLIQHILNEDKKLGEFYKNTLKS